MYLYAETKLQTSMVFTCLWQNISSTSEVKCIAVFIFCRQSPGRDQERKEKRCTFARSPNFSFRPMNVQVSLATSAQSEVCIVFRFLSIMCNLHLSPSTGLSLLNLWTLSEFFEPHSQVRVLDCCGFHVAEELFFPSVTLSGALRTSIRVTSLL